MTEAQKCAYTCTQHMQVDLQVLVISCRNLRSWWWLVNCVCAHEPMQHDNVQGETAAMSVEFNFIYCLVSTWAYMHGWGWAWWQLLTLTTLTVVKALRVSFFAVTNSDPVVILGKKKHRPGNKKTCEDHWWSDHLFHFLLFLFISCLSVSPSLPNPAVDNHQGGLRSAQFIRHHFSHEILKVLKWHAKSP